MTKSTYKMIKMVLSIFCIGSGFAFIFLLIINQKGEPFKDNALEWKESGWIRYCDIIHKDNGWIPKVIEESNIPCIETKETLFIHGSNGKELTCFNCNCRGKVINRGLFAIKNKPPPPLPDILNFSCY